MVESRQKTHFGNESRECKKKQAGKPDKLICGLTQWYVDYAERSREKNNGSRLLFY